MVYEKGGPSVFKNFQFISQLFYCVFIIYQDNNFLRFVLFLIDYKTMSRQLFMSVAT